MLSLLFFLIHEYQKYISISVSDYTKDRIISEWGIPDEDYAIVKDVDHYWGPIESVWYSIEFGDSVIVWQYNSILGKKQLYFVNEVDTVKGENFHWRINRFNPVY